jgi:hypothetical protein
LFWLQVSKKFPTSELPKGLAKTIYILARSELWKP